MRQRSSNLALCSLLLRLLFGTEDAVVVVVIGRLDDLVTSPGWPLLPNFVSLQNWQKGSTNLGQEDYIYIYVYIYTYMRIWKNA